MVSGTFAVFGGSEYAMRIWVHPDQLAHYNLYRTGCGRQTERTEPD